MFSNSCIVMSIDCYFLNYFLDMIQFYSSIANNLFIFINCHENFSVLICHVLDNSLIYSPTFPGNVFWNLPEFLQPYLTEQESQHLTHTSSLTLVGSHIPHRLSSRCTFSAACETHTYTHIQVVHIQNEFVFLLLPVFSSTLLEKLSWVVVKKQLHRSVEWSNQQTGDEKCRSSEEKMAF